MVVVFLALGYWQVTRAANGNLLSFGYAIEWPVFAGFTSFGWLKEMRRARGDATPAPPPAPVRRTAATPPPPDDSDDEELVAYNRYLAWRNENPHATRADYPG